MRPRDHLFPAGNPLMGQTSSSYASPAKSIAAIKITASTLKSLGKKSLPNNSSELKVIHANYDGNHGTVPCPDNPFCVSNCQNQHPETVSREYETPLSSTPVTTQNPIVSA
ncbi:hypothetical protein CEXT_563411 [Caerostris extrusa]|uniref:Uncharacterized protein n=1 Tax=Caerostris extrusa TaxID=172846 RepID=A0AAV4WC42_CAEEX|nr:hypothetical protein CEXT_563411 [Caerostris extrusa]